MKINKADRNIFQICINLNDNVDALKESKKKLLELNPEYDYHYITSEEELYQAMRDSFEKSQDLFDQKIFECFDRVERILKYGKKTSTFEDPIEKEEHHKICGLVSRTDIFRYAMIYKYGGLYCDLSSKCEVDVDKELAQYDIFLVKSDIQVYTSLIYGKNNSPVLRKVLAHIIETTEQAQTKSVCQMYLGGPRMLTAVISDLSESYDLSKFNGKIAQAEKISSWFLVQSYDWKKQLHQPDPSRPFLKINSHWLNKNF